MSDPLRAEYGLLSHASPNLGDEIQSLAARRFLPRVDRWVPRERLDADPGGSGPTRVILAGWFLHHPRRWPPHEKIDPLLVGFHLNDRRLGRLRWRTAARVLLSRRRVGWLRRHGPVGARDRRTLELLRRAGVDAEYSGCLTLTLPPRDPAAVGDRVVASCLPDALAAALARRTRRPPVRVDHLDTRTAGPQARMERAQALLDVYARARAVVTTRLHCALPCLALGTPVLFIPLLPDLARQEPALELAHHRSAGELLDGRAGWDPEDPPPNPDAWRAFVPGLVQRCREFVSG
ncbi:MAG TPA: polysaccharide pyruvyl transferase family protein [Longimicrobium sp.]|nr:polysaccharide pyruvyl transferase family protein [Longimicrobium sp.]